MTLLKAYVASKDAQILAATQRAERAEKQRDDLQLAASVATGAGHAMLELMGGKWPLPRATEESLP